LTMSAFLIRRDMVEIVYSVRFSVGGVSERLIL